MNVLRRFRDAFAYNRYRELFEKEAQNRELTIQNGLERVRSRAQGMQESAEISDVSQTVFDELKVLGIDPFRTEIVVIDHTSDSIDTWVTREGHALHLSFSISRALELWSRFAPKKSRNVFLQEFGEAAYEGRAPYCYVLDEDGVRALYAVVSGLIDISDEYLAELVAKTPVPLYHHAIYFENGYIMIDADHELPEDHV